MPDLTVADVAVRLKETPLTVRRWLESGALVGIARDDRAACRIRETDLATFLDARRRGGVQERPRRPLPSTDRAGRTPRTTSQSGHDQPEKEHRP